MKALLAIIIVALLAVSLWRSGDESPGILPEAATPEVLQAYMNDFHMLAMDEQGKPALEMTADTMKQYSNRKLAELENPQITMRDASQQWRIMSQQGLVDSHQQTVALHNQVVLQQIDADSGRKLEIRTRSLNIDVDQQRARTDDAVTIIVDEAELHSQGMILDNRNGTLQLLADVRGVIHVE